MKISQYAIIYGVFLYRVKLMIKVHLDFSNANETELSTFFSIPKVAGAIDNLSQLQDKTTLNLTITKDSESNNNDVIDSSNLIFDK